MEGESIRFFVALHFSIKEKIVGNQAPKWLFRLNDFILR